MHAKIMEDILEIMITYLEMLPLVLQHVEAVTSCGSFPCLASHVSCSWTACNLCHAPFLPYVIACPLSNLWLDL